MLNLFADQLEMSSIMKTLPLSEAKTKLSGLVEQVRTRNEEIMITKNGRPVAVLVSPEELEKEVSLIISRLDPEEAKTVDSSKLKDYAYGIIRNEKVFKMLEGDKNKPKINT